MQAVAATTGVPVRDNLVAAGELNVDRPFSGEAVLRVRHEITVSLSRFGSNVSFQSPCRISRASISDLLILMPVGYSFVSRSQ